MTRIILIAFLSILCIQTHAQPGANDPSFNTFDNGTLGNGTGFNQIVRTTVIQADGKIISAGNFTTYNGTTRTRIARLNSDGSLDTSFDPGTGFNALVYSVALQADGKIIVGGDFTSFNGTACTRIARLNADGSLDATFNAGTGFNLEVYSVKVQTNGKILVGGRFITFNGISKNNIIRLNSDGSVDASFNIGTGCNDSVWSISLQTDGKILIGGAFSSYNGSLINQIARLNTDGSLDATFNPGTGVDGTILATAIQLDGKIVVGGYFTTFNGVSRKQIARLNINGSIDATFNPGTGFTELAFGNGVYTLSIQADGKIVAGGGFIAFNGTSLKSIARLNTDGTLDATFYAGASYNNPVYSTAIQVDGKIIVGGGFYFSNGIDERRNILRLNIDGSLDTTFKQGTGFVGDVFSTAIQSDGKILVGGYFSSFNGQLSPSIARLNSDGSLDVTFNPGTGFNNAVRSIAIQSDGKIIVGGSFTLFNGTARARIARLNADGSLDATFNPGTGFDTDVYSVSLKTDGKIIVGGGFNSYNGVADQRIARLNSDGSLDVTFFPPPAFNNIVFTTAVQPDGKIIVGGIFTSINGVACNRIARLNANGSLDLTYNLGTGFNSGVYNVTLQFGRIIAVGDFTSYNGTARVRIARLNSDGTLDPTFDSGSGFNTAVWSVVNQSGGNIIVGGQFTTYNGIAQNRITRLNMAGSLDVTFDTGIGFNGNVWTLAIQADEKIIVGGSFLSFNGIGRNKIARLLNCYPTTGTAVISSCDPIVWIDGNTYATNNTTATHVLTSVAGCDSTVTLNFTRKLATTGTAVISSCDPIVWIDGNTYATSNTTATHVLTNAAGCDSIVTLNFTRKLATTGTAVISSCDPIIWIDGNTYATSNTTATHVLTNAAGCDSTVTLNFTRKLATTGTAIISSCDPIIWIDGNTYATSNTTATHVLTNAAGCDSTVTLNFTRKLATTGTAIISSCDPIVWIDGNTYATSNSTATHVLTNAAGCDSTVTLNFTRKLATTGTAIISSCDPIIWIDGNTYATSNTTATHVLTNAAGCDSTVTLNFTRKLATTGTAVISSCDPIVWIDGNTYATSNSTATHVLTNAAGCDSTVTLNFTRFIIDATTTLSSITISANEGGATYQWIDCANGNAPLSGETNQSFTATVNGTYAVIVTQNNCSDTSACTAITSVGIDDHSSLVEMRLQPNPTFKEVTIVTNAVIEKVEIYTMAGELVQKEFTHAFSVEELTRGIYLVKVISSEGMSTLRLIKE